MKQVLIAVDGSDWSQVAAHYALEFVRGSQREVVALGVLPPEVIQSLGESPETLAFSPQVPEGEQMGRRTLKDWFDQAESLCAEAGVCFARTVDSGQAAERLEWASLTSYLVALGAHGAHGTHIPPNGQGLGHTALHMVRNSLKPMLITRREYRPIKRVLLGWDMHPQAGHAAEMILAPAQRQGWEIVIASGAQPTSPMAQTCNRLAEAFGEEGVAAEAYVTPGNSPAIIFDAIAKFQPDLLVIGGHRRTTRGLLSEGSWLEILEQVTIPTLLYR
ncbi:MAG TPA: universal stress protein [Armatimonadota bacterium]|jgi:nucleotide-binding universal stress UspA family protein